MNLAVFGSRKGVHLERVGVYLSDRGRAVKDTVLVSGGADGVDRYAEQTWQALGGRVISLRPIKLAEEEYGVERWEFGGNQPPLVYKLIDHPVFGDWKSAAHYRSLLIAEISDRGVAFRAGGNRSRGTTFTIEAFLKTYGKPCAVHEEE